MTSRRNMLIVFCGWSLAAALPAISQQRRIRRIALFALVTPDSPASRSFSSGFRKGMTELGWVEGRDFSIEARFAGDVAQSAVSVAGELVASNPEVLVTTGVPEASLLSGQTKTIPIVFGVAQDPVGAGLVRSLQRPGGNVTGMMTLSSDLGAKRLELLRETIPRARHVAVIIEPDTASSTVQLQVIQAAARRLNIQITSLSVRSAADIPAAFKQSATLRADANLLTQSPLIINQTTAIVEQSSRLRIPTIFLTERAAEEGGLMSYGPDANDLFRRSAAYADKILRGANPGELPIQQPTQFDLVVNTRTARAIGLAIPEPVLLRATRIIE